MKTIVAALLLALSMPATARNMIMLWRDEVVHVGNFSIIHCHFRDFRTILTISVRYPTQCPPWIDVKPDMTYETPSWFDRKQIVRTP